MLAVGLVAAAVAVGPVAAELAAAAAVAVAIELVVVVVVAAVVVNSFVACNAAPTPKPHLKHLPRPYSQRPKEPLAVGSPREVNLGA